MMDRLELLETAQVAMNKAHEARRLAVSAENSSTAVFVNLARQYNPDGFDHALETLNEGLNMSGNDTYSPALEAAKAVVIFARTSVGEAIAQFARDAKPDPDSWETWSDDIREQGNKKAS